MGAQAKTHSDSVAKEEAELAKLNEELRLDMVQAGLDVAGVFDPTPASDLAGAGLSVYRGDLIGAGLSLISIIPYAGDAIAKTAKGARALKRMNALRKRIEAAIAATRLARKLKFAAKRLATARLRAKRAADQARKIAEAEKCPTCRAPSGNRFGTTSPTTKGHWSGEKGNSTWHPDPNTTEGKEILAATGGKPIEFKDGYPDFSPHARERVEIDMTGNSKKDMKAARDAMREKLNDPKWETPDDWTWHHNEDGVTMELVPTALNGNIPHSGGDSLTKELLNDPGY